MVLNKAIRENYVFDSISKPKYWLQCKWALFLAWAMGIHWKYTQSFKFDRHIFETWDQRNLSKSVSSTLLEVYTDKWECAMCSVQWDDQHRSPNYMPFLFASVEIIIITSTERLQTLCVNLKQMQTQQAKLSAVAK